MIAVTRPQRRRHGVHGDVAPQRCLEVSPGEDVVVHADGHGAEGIAGLRSGPGIGNAIADEHIALDLQQLTADRPRVHAEVARGLDEPGVAAGFVRGVDAVSDRDSIEVMVVGAIEPGQRCRGPLNVPRTR